jgi:RNA polymerase sigma-70 factor (ECF subfamily)
MDVDGEFPAIVEAHQDALYRFLLRLSGNSHDAEEMAQEAFVRAYRWLKAHDQAQPALKAWLYQVSLNVFRNRNRRPTAPAGRLEQAAEVVDANGPDPHAEAERSEAGSELARALARLPRRYREAVVLRHVEELTYPEIAALMARPEGTIKSDVHRGLGLLRAALSPLREEVLV